MTYQNVQRMVIIIDNLLEVVVDSIGVTETLTVCISETYLWLVYIVLVCIVANIVCCQAPETLVILGVKIISELCLNLELVEDLPTERTCHVEILALASAVVIILRLQRIVEVTQVIVVRTC